MLQGDFGYSMLYNAPVSQVIGGRFATSFALLFSAWLFSGIVGLAMGLTAGRYLNHWPDAADLDPVLCAGVHADVLDWLAVAVTVCRDAQLGTDLLCLDPGGNAETASWGDKLRHLIPAHAGPGGAERKTSRPAYPFAGGRGDEQRIYPLRPYLG